MSNMYLCHVGILKKFIQIVKISKLARTKTNLFIILSNIQVGEVFNFLICFEKNIIRICMLNTSFSHYKITNKLKIQIFPSILRIFHYFIIYINLKLKNFF